MSNPIDSFFENKDLGREELSDLPDINVSKIPKKTKFRGSRPNEQEILEASHQAGFQDRGGNSTSKKNKHSSKARKNIPKKHKIRRSASYETGRKVPKTIKMREVVRDRLDKIADQHEWVSGQLLEYAIDALEEKLVDENDPFWIHRKFYGVD